MKDFDIFTTELFPYLEGEEVKNSTLTLTIKDIRQEKMKSQSGREESKYVLYFSETHKGFVLNKTNAKRVATLHGKMTGAWAGKQITLYTEEVKAFGETHNALRVAIAVNDNAGNGEMNLGKLLATLDRVEKGDKVEYIKGFYTLVSIMDCWGRDAQPPAPDDTDGWRQLFVDARDHAFEQIERAIEEGKIPIEAESVEQPSEAVIVQSAMDEVEAEEDAQMQIESGQIEDEIPF